MEISEIGFAVAAAQPVLFLGEVVVADAGAMQFSQCLLGRVEIVEIAVRLCHLQRDAIDEASYQRLPTGPQQLGPDIEIARQCQRAPLAREQMPRQ